MNVSKENLSVEKISGIFSMKEVTPFSKILATLLFIILPFVGFGLGILVAAAYNTNVNTTIVRDLPKVTVTSEPAVGMLSGKYIDGNIPAAKWENTNEQTNPQTIYEEVRNLNQVCLSLNDTSLIYHGVIKSYNEPFGSYVGIEVAECETNKTNLESIAQLLAPNTKDSRFQYVPNSGKSSTRFGLTGLSGYTSTKPYGYFELYVKDKKLIFIFAVDPNVDSSQKVQYDQYRANLWNEFFKEVKLK